MLIRHIVRKFSRFRAFAYSSFTLTDFIPELNIIDHEINSTNMKQEFCSGSVDILSYLCSLRYLFFTIDMHFLNFISSVL